MQGIRLATERDIPAVLHLLRQVNLVHHLGRPDLFRRATKYDEAELNRLFADPDMPVFVYEDAAGSILGHAFCVVERIEGDRLLCDRTTLYIDDICVEETARLRGVGAALYRHAEAYAKSLGCHNLTLNVWTCNPDALRFYEQMGLTPQKICMEKRL